MGYFPLIFKNGLIILIPKPGKDPRQPVNYRPITLLEIPGKILERIVNNRLQRFLEENEILNKNQYGFRAGRGTDMAIIKIYEKIAMNQKGKNLCNVTLHPKVCFHAVIEIFRIDVFCLPDLCNCILQVSSPRLLLQPSVNLILLSMINH